MLILGGLALLTNMFATNMVMLIISRAFVGLTGGAAYSVGLMGIGQLYSDPKERGRYLALTGTIMAICMLLASIVTGLIVDMFGWRIVTVYHLLFFVLGVVFIIIGAKIPNEEASTHVVKADLTGIIGLALFLAGFNFALSLGSGLVPWGSPLNIVFFVALVVGLITLIVDIMRKRERALIPLNVLKNKNFLLLFGSYATNVISAMAFFIFLPYFVMYVMEQSATTAGIIMLVLNIPGVFMGAVFGKTIVKSGSVKSSVLICSIGRLVGMIMLALIVTASSPVWLMCIITFLAGFTSALGNSAFNTAGQIQLPRSLQAQAIPTLGMGAGVGAIIGTALCTTFISQGIAEGFIPCLWISCAVLVLSMLLVLPLKSAKDIGEIEEVQQGGSE
jgi:MFS family permease